MKIGKRPERTPEELDALIDRMKDHLTPDRWEKIQHIASLRTRYISVVLENIYYTQNMSAVVRTCDSLGIQNLHVVGQLNSARINKNVAQGASSWTTIRRDTRRPVEEALQAIKDDGYRLVATLPREDATPLDRLDISKGRIAIIFGQEVCGLSETAARMADEAVTIPMYGLFRIIQHLCFRRHLSLRIEKEATGVGHPVETHSGGNKRTYTPLD